MITLLNKTYDGESICDCHRDFSEAFDERFTPENAQITQDEHGFAEGEYRVTVQWHPKKTVDPALSLALLNGLRDPIYGLMPDVAAKITQLVDSSDD